MCPIYISVFQYHSNELTETITQLRINSSTKNFKCDTLKKKKKKKKKKSLIYETNKLDSIFLQPVRVMR